MFKWFKEMEFSKSIIVWAMILSTICIVGYSIGFFIIEKLPKELITLIGTILTGTVLGYMTKAGFENVNKIKQNTSDTLAEEEKTTKKTTKKVVAKVGVINTNIPEIDYTSTEV